jgi:integrase
MNRSVNLSKRITTAEGSRYCPVVTANNGRVKPNWVIVGGKPEHHPEGAYYLSWYESNTLKRRSVGTDANAAAARQHKQEQILASKAAGIRVLEDAPKGRLLVNAAADYLKEIEAHKKEATHQSYSYAIKYFLESCSKQTLEEITREDLLAFSVFLRNRFRPYTSYVKFKCVIGFLKSQGITKLISSKDWPQFTDEMPEIYEPEELTAFFAACNPEEHLWFSFFLMTGMREQEVMHTAWKAVHFSENTISVKHNAEFGWSPKAYKEREIPVPQKLMDSLKKWSEMRSPRCGLVFPTGKCQPQQKFLDACKVVAERAGLDPKNFWLHKFRATFATLHLQTGVDLRTLQSWLGHSDLESTMRYLRPAKGQAVRDRVEATFA